MHSNTSRPLHRRLHNLRAQVRMRFYPIQFEVNERETLDAEGAGVLNQRPAPPSLQLQYWRPPRGPPGGRLDFRYVQNPASRVPIPVHLSLALKGMGKPVLPAESLPAFVAREWDMESAPHRYWYRVDHHTPQRFLRRATVLEGRGRGDL